MASQKFPAFKLPDAELLRALRTIAAELPMTPATFTFQLAEQGSAIANLKEDQLETSDFLRHVSETGAAIIWRMSVRTQSSGYSVDVQRGGTADEVTASFPDHQGGEQTQNLKFLALLHTHLHAYTRTAATDEVLGKEMAEFYSQRDQILGRLELLNARILESNEAYRLKLENETDATRLRFQEQYDQRSHQFDAEHRRREEALSQRDAELSKRESEFDNRKSTHARRQIRQDVKKIIADRTESFHLSSDTTHKRLPIHILFVLLITSSATLFGSALLGYLPVPASLPAWFSAVRLPLITAALAASVVFYIRWADTWFRQHADEELRLKRLELDIDRASWVVEMALEWKEEKGREIPVELIERLSRNLFEIEPSRRARHPTEDLTSALLGATSGLSVNIPGVGEATIDRKGINAFKKIAQRDDAS